MYNLRATLQDSDSALLPVLAQCWRVDTDYLDRREMLDALREAMLDSERIERVWQSLDDGQRGAMQTLLGAGGKMTAPMFERLFGEIRKLGAAQIERDKPLENPASIAEALYYRGLIFESFEKAESGMHRVVYVPTDLAAKLPTHQTAYSDLGGDDAEDGELTIEALEEVENVRQADTSIVDDMTTLLAYLQLHGVDIGEGVLSDDDCEAVTAHLLVDDAERLTFLLGMGISADLITVQDGVAHPKRAEVRSWLSGKRSEQVKWMAEAWRENTIYRDLWHVPGLYPEPANWLYNPAMGRSAILTFMDEFVPKKEWWSLDIFIFTMKEEDPDFQRPDGNYDNWYIRNEAGDYLNGFESWDAVEGALLEFYLMGPMHWLGLVDLADEAVRLTAYGRAFLSGGQWPTSSEPEEKVIVTHDGTMLASRKVSRLDRFQLARFTTWGAPGTLEGAKYSYKLDAEGIRQAAGQGINTGHITAFVKRMLGDEPMPPMLVKLLETWQKGATSTVTFERLMVLRTTAPETMDRIFDDPPFRRYLGARLGPMACVVRVDEWEALRDALGENGIEVEVIE